MASRSAQARGRPAASATPHRRGGPRRPAQPAAGNGGRSARIRRAVRRPRLRPDRSRISEVGQARSAPTRLPGSRAAPPSARRWRPALPASAARTGTSDRRASGRQSRIPACGVDRSLPEALLYARNSAVMTTQTVWLPTSSALVSQQPLRKKPVIGRVEQMSSVPPSTLRDGPRPDGVRFRQTAWRPPVWRAGIYHPRRRTDQFHDRQPQRPKSFGLCCQRSGETQVDAFEGEGLDHASNCVGTPSAGPTSARRWSSVCTVAPCSDAVARCSASPARRLSIC